MQTTLKHIPLFSGKARIATHFFSWAFIAVTIFYLLNSVCGSIEALQRTLVNVSFMITLFYVNARIIVNNYAETGKIGPLIGFIVVFLLLMTSLRYYLEKLIFTSSFLHIDQTNTDGNWRLFIGFLFYFSVVMLFSALYQLVENRRLLEFKHLELGIKHQEAELNYLKSQINPHFLFNTLNNIYSAVQINHPKSAEMILKLSDLLRYVTYETQEVMVSLTDEINHIRNYTELFQLKSEYPLPITINIEGKIEQWEIAPLLLLPFVENALKHGNIDCDNNHPFLHIQINADNNSLDCVFSNSYNPVNNQKDAVGGVGLENVRNRLELYYPEQHQLSIQKDDSRFTARLTIKA